MASSESVVSITWCDHILTADDNSSQVAGERNEPLHIRLGAIKSAVFSIIRCIIAYLSVRVVSLKEKPKVIIRVCRPFI